jgi:hypothetical protein
MDQKGGGGIYRTFERSLTKHRRVCTFAADASEVANTKNLNLSVRQHRQPQKKLNFCFYFKAMMSAQLENVQKRSLFLMKQLPKLCYRIKVRH